MDYRRRCASPRRTGSRNRRGGRAAGRCCLGTGSLRRTPPAWPGGRCSRRPLHERSRLARDGALIAVGGALAGGGGGAAWTGGGAAATGGGGARTGCGAATGAGGVTTTGGGAAGGGVTTTCCCALSRLTSA